MNDPLHRGTISLQLRAARAIAVIIVLALLYVPRLADHMRESADPLVFNDDARQVIWPFLRYTEPKTPPDLLADLQLAMSPPGYRALYRVSAPVLKPRTLSKVLPYVLLLATLLGVGVAAAHLGGAFAAWSALALMLPSEPFLAQMAGGLSRGFGYPLTALAAVSLIFGKPNALALMAVLGSLFYPPIGYLASVSLLLLVGLPRRLTGLGEKWTPPRRLAVLGVTGALVLAVALASLSTLSVYGPGVSDAARFPEAAPGQRLDAIDTFVRPPATSLLTRPAYWIGRTLTGSGDPWIAQVRAFGDRYEAAIVVLAIAAVVIGGWRLRHVQAARRFLLLPAAVGLSFVSAWLLLPRLYVPDRYLKFGLPLTFVILLPAALSALGTRPGRRDRSGWLLLSATLALLLLRGGRGDSRAGLTVAVDPAERPFYDYLAALPPDALIAGWPETLDNVPYLTGRRALLTYETHVPLFEGYTTETRRRMSAFLDAYFAADDAPLARLRDEFGVTHLVVDERHFGTGPPSYFAPYDTMMTRLWRDHQPVFETLRLSRGEGAFRLGQLSVVDLDSIRKMPSGPHPRP